MDYDSVSKNYDVSRRAGARTVEQLAELLAPLAGADVLDIGCGTGNFLVELSNVGGQVVGLDSSAGMLQEAKSKGAGADLIQGDAVLMPFCEEVFDAAYCIQVLHHIRDKAKFMSQVYRVLKKRGKFVIQTCSHEQLATFWEFHYFPRGLEIDRARCPDVPEITNLLGEAGFRDVSVHACPFEDVFRFAPDIYLDKRYRDGQSEFSLLTPEEIEEGCERIREDMQAGRTEGVVAAYDEKAERIGRVSFIRGRKA